MTQTLTIKWTKDNVSKMLYMLLLREAKSRGCETSYTTRQDRTESRLTIKGASQATSEVISRLVNGLGVEIDSKKGE
ncbi:MAG: hypothetical protein QM703_22840 [Gemmatales bacterium]